MEVHCHLDTCGGQVGYTYGTFVRDAVLVVLLGVQLMLASGGYIWEKSGELWEKMVVHGGYIGGKLGEGSGISGGTGVSSGGKVVVIGRKWEKIGRKGGYKLIIFR